MRNQLERVELIKKFLQANKDLVKVSGVENRSGLKKTYWAKILCGGSDGGYSSKPIEETKVTLVILRKELDKLIEKL